jgi:metal-dependent amidase/aminoacylase/carboxypeptidase family protein
MRIFQVFLSFLFFFIGVSKRRQDASKAAPHHGHEFYVDASAIEMGVKAMRVLLRLSINGLISA